MDEQFSNDDNFNLRLNSGLTMALTQMQIIQSLGKAMAWFEREFQWGVPPTELRHLSGRIELYSALITNGQMTTEVNQKGYDVVSSLGEKVSVKKDIREKLSKNDVIDMEIQWKEKDKTINCRMIVSWNPVANYFQYLTTNLPRDTFSPEHIIDAYRLRWQIELMFKEWKSFANLRTFVTEKQAIVEGLIWASLCAAILKRFIAHVAQKATGIAISTHKVAKSACYFMDDIMNSLIHEPVKIRAVLEKTVLYLKNNARRDSIKRDKKSGRSKLGLNPLFGV